MANPIRRRSHSQFRIFCPIDLQIGCITLKVHELYYAQLCLKKFKSALIGNLIRNLSASISHLPCLQQQLLLTGTVMWTFAAVCCSTCWCWSIEQLCDWCLKSSERHVLLQPGETWYPNATAEKSVRSVFFLFVIKMINYQKSYKLPGFSKESSSNLNVDFSNDGKSVLCVLDPILVCLTELPFFFFYSFSKFWLRDLNV